MEYKVRRESATMMEKIFNNHSRKGTVRSEVIGKMLKELNPDMAFDASDLSQEIGLADGKGTGHLDLEGFNKIAMHFLIRQTRRDSDQFTHKHEVLVEDMPGGFRPSGKHETPFSGQIADRSKFGMDAFSYKHQIDGEDFLPVMAQ